MTGDEYIQPVETLDSIAAAMDEPELDSDMEQETDEEVTEESDEAETEEDEESGETEEQEEESTFDLKVDGKEVNLKQSEVLSLAQKGFDYTQKTMALADERKAFEAERESVQQYRHHYEQKSQEVTTALESLYEFAQQQVGQAPDISVAHYDTNAYLEQKHQYEARQGQLAQIGQALQYQREQAQRERQEYLSQRGMEAERELKNTLDGWNDEMADDLAKYASNLGLAPNQVDSPYVTAGFWKLLAKAQAYDKLQETKATIKPTKTIAKVASPKGSPAKQPESLRHANAIRKFDANPTIDNLANLI